MNEARERVAEALDHVLDECHISPDVVSKYVVLDQSDAVIAHLWERASDPEVQEAVARIIPEQGEGESWSGLIEFWPTIAQAHRNVAKMQITALLTALIGPRPEGADDGQ